MITLGELIRQQRVKEGLLLRQLAAKLDLDPAVLSKIERGDRKATRNQIVKIAEILSLDQKELLIQYLSENIVLVLANEDVAAQALRAVEIKLDLLKKNRND